jgi:hypothetical protein
VSRRIAAGHRASLKIFALDASPPPRRPRAHMSLGPTEAGPSRSWRSWSLAPHPHEPLPVGASLALAGGFVLFVGHRCRASPGRQPAGAYAVADPGRRRRCRRRVARRRGQLVAFRGRSGSAPRCGQATRRGRRRGGRGGRAPVRDVRCRRGFARYGDGFRLVAQSDQEKICPMAEGIVDPCWQDQPDLRAPIDHEAVLRREIASSGGRSYPARDLDVAGDLCDGWSRTPTAATSHGVACCENRQRAAGTRRVHQGKHVRSRAGTRDTRSRKIRPLGNG